MSSKIALESRQRLPSKMQNIVCDSALVMQHAACAAGSSEILNSCAKQLCVTEQFFGATSMSLDKLDAALNAMQQRSDEVESKITVVSDVLEITQTVERYKYFTEEGLRPACESDVDSIS